MEFQIIAQIESPDKAQMLVTMDFFRNNYPSQTKQAVANRKTFTVKAILKEALYSNALSIFENIDSTFSDSQITELKMQMDE